MNVQWNFELIETILKYTLTDILRHNTNDLMNKPMLC